MASSFFITICRIYFFALLLAAAILSPLPYSVIMLLLLLISLLAIYRRSFFRFGTPSIMAAIFILPLALELPLEHLLPITNEPAVYWGIGLFGVTQIHLIAASLVLPLVYLFQQSLKKDAGQKIPFQDSRPFREGRYITAVPVSLLLAAFIMLLVSFMIASAALFLTSSILILYLLSLFSWVLGTTKKPLLCFEPSSKKIIAGATARIKLTAINKASFTFGVKITPLEDWCHIKPSRFIIHREKQELEVTVTPPLSGPLNPELLIISSDSFGFTHTNHKTEPIKLQVIPRARYARWLAEKYLENSGASGSLSTNQLITELYTTRGTEYLDSRDYRPGDELRYIDWKHSLKLRNLLIKEFTESDTRAVLVSINLSVSDTEEADKLAFNLITTTLTLAQMGIPTSLTAYTCNSVIASIPPGNPRNVLIKSLELIKGIDKSDFGRRFLGLTDITRLRNNLKRLKQLSSISASRLAAIFDFEYKSINEQSRNNPASSALSQAIKKMPQMATVLFISHLNHDAEAILLYKARIDRMGYSSLIMNGEYADNMTLNIRPRQNTGRECEAGINQPSGCGLT